MALGEEIIVFNGTGLEWRVKIESLENGKIGAIVSEQSQPNTEPRLRVTLYQSIIKKNNFEWVAQKCAELGVSEFVPVLASRSEKKSFNAARLKKIIQEACEQSGRVKIPLLQETKLLNNALAQASKPILFLHFDKVINPTLPPLMIRGGVGGVNFLNENKISLFIGPEGGWTQEECAAAREKGVIFASLGPRILRSKTAAVAATVLILNS